MPQRRAKQRSVDTNGRTEGEIEPAVPEELFRRFVASVQDYGIVLLDPQGRIISWNAGAERLTGYHAGEVLGKSIAIVATPEEIARGKPEKDLRAAATQQRFDTEGWRVGKDGSRRWIHATVTA